MTDNTSMYCSETPKMIGTSQIRAICSLIPKCCSNKFTQLHVQLKALSIITRQNCLSCNGTLHDVYDQLSDEMMKTLSMIVHINSFVAILTLLVD